VSSMRTYVTISAAVMAASIVALILLVSVVDLGLSTDGLVALFLGAIFTMGITLVLMGLVFRSSRGGRDRIVHSGTSYQDPASEPASRSRLP
jgi:hypothetical protein